METWRLITTWGATPAFNMGLDEALLASPGAPTTLRLYTWSPDTLSLGYFQRFEDVRGTDTAGVVVRRITGGGAIHHTGELTFSIAADASHRLYAGPVSASYRRVHHVVAAALAEHGVTAELRGERDLASDRDDTGMCFHHSTDLDLVWGDRKGVGSAQRRKAGRVLHHGSIKLRTSELEGDIAVVDAAGSGLEAAELGATLRRTLSRMLDVQLEAGVPTPAERTAAHELGSRYLDPEFLRRR